MTEVQRIGSSIFGAGFIFLMLGIIFGLNRRFIVSGNIEIILGMLLMWGFRETFSFMFKKEKIKGSLSYFCGIALIILNLKIPGVLCQIIGGYWLFGGFLPVVGAALRKIPIISYFVPSSWRKEDLD